MRAAELKELLDEGLFSGGTGFQYRQSNEYHRLKRANKLVGR
jgi:hypothetical protein